MEKLYAVYLAYHKNEVMPEELAQDPNVPEYPPSIARLRVYDNKGAQLECYANTRCPASQLIDADSTEDLEAKVKQMRDNFLNEDWLDENVRPYI